MQLKKKGTYKKTVVFYPHYDDICLRVYVKPANPQSINQQRNRFLFRFISYIGQSLLSTVIPQFWNFQDKLNIGFNFFQHINTIRSTGVNDFQNILMTSGNLEPVFNIGFIEYKDAAGRCIFKWSTETTGTGSLSDKIFLVLIDTKDFLTLPNCNFIDVYTNSDKIREDSVGFILPPKNLETQYLHGYISAFKEPTISVNDLSISKYKKVSAR